MADRSLVEIALQTAAGAARTSKTLTFFEEDGTTPLAQSLYAAQSGGSALVAPFTTGSVNGTFRAYADTPQRGVAVASDDSLVPFPVAFEPDPADFILRAQTNRHIGSLRLGTAPGTLGATLEVVDPYAGWAGSVLTQNYDGLRVDVGGYGIANERRAADSVAMLAAVAGVVKVPAGATSVAFNGQAIGVAGQVWSASANAVALYADARSAANGVGLWLINGFLEDRGFTIPTAAHGYEINALFQNSANVFWGIDMIGGGAYAGTSAAGFGGGVYHPWVGMKMRPLSSGVGLNVTTKWLRGIDFEPDSCLFAINLDQQSAGNGWGSNVIRAGSTSSGGATREAYLFVNKDGEWIIRPGASGATTILRMQAANVDQSSAGTTHVVATTTGLGINLPSEGVPGKPLEVYKASAAFNMIARLANFDSGASVGPFLGFAATGGAETVYAKAGIGLERTAANGRGKLHFLQRDTADTVEAALTNSVGFIDRDGGFVIGASGATAGTGTLVVLNSIAAGTTINATGVMNSALGTATTAAGAQALKLGASGPHIYVGSGAPTVSAVKGSLYLRTDGSGTTDRAYVNTNGSTTWTALTTVA